MYKWYTFYNEPDPLSTRTAQLELGEKSILMHSK